MHLSDEKIFFINIYDFFFIYWMDRTRGAPLYAE